MIKLGIYGSGLTLVTIGALCVILGIHAVEIAGALCIERE